MRLPWMGRALRVNLGGYVYHALNRAMRGCPCSPRTAIMPLSSAC